MSETLSKGEIVRVRKLGTSDDWTMGQVVLVSQNGVSAAIQLDGVVRAGSGFQGGVLPLIIDQDAGTASGLMGDEYEVEVSGRESVVKP